MPEMSFRIRWPDDAIQQCYSPSLVIRDHLEVGSAYSIVDFMDRSRLALNTASERVRAKYGFSCSRAIGQLAELEKKAARFGDHSDGEVTILSFEE